MLPMKLVKGKLLPKKNEEEFLLKKLVPQEKMYQKKMGTKENYY